MAVTSYVLTPLKHFTASRGCGRSTGYVALCIGLSNPDHADGGCYDYAISDSLHIRLLSERPTIFC
jgi:hypothetical protein